MVWCLAKTLVSKLCSKMTSQYYPVDIWLSQPSHLCKPGESTHILQSVMQRHHLISVCKDAGFCKQHYWIINPCPALDEGKSYFKWNGTDSLPKKDHDLEPLSDTILSIIWQHTGQISNFSSCFVQHTWAVCAISPGVETYIGKYKKTHSHGGVSVPS